MIVRHPVTGRPIPAIAIKFIHHKGSDNKPKPTVFFFTPTNKLIFCSVSIIIALALHDQPFDAPSLTNAAHVLSTENRGPMICTALRWKESMLKVHDPRFTTFHSAYINERVEFDLQNTFLENPTEDKLIRMFAHVSITRDPRATRDMVPDDVWRNLPPDPKIFELEERRAELKGGQYRIKGQKGEAEIRKLSNKIRSMRAQRENSIVMAYREYFFYNRPTWDIERQARGEAPDEYAEPAIDIQIPERARLAKILCHQPDSWTDEEIWQRRIEAIGLMVALCDRRETVKSQRIRRSAQAAVPTKRESPEPDLFPLLMQKTQCPRCIGDGRMTYAERMFPYCRPTVMNDHFDREHLKEMEDLERDNLVICDHPKCREDGLKLKSVDHFRNHVQTVHGVKLRLSWRSA